MVNPHRLLLLPASALLALHAVVQDGVAEGARKRGGRLGDDAACPLANGVLLVDGAALADVLLDRAEETTCNSRRHFDFATHDNTLTQPGG